MSMMRALAERNSLPKVGARFFCEGDEVMFEFIVDPNTVIGPRPATRRDQEQHAGAWEEFRRAEGVSALDRDADGEDGGSLAVESQSAPEPTPPVVEEAPKPRRARKAVAK